MAEGRPELLTPITEAPVYLKVEAWYAAAAEGALHLEDILARRMRISIEYPHRGVDCAREVAEVVAPVLGWSAEDVDREVATYIARVDAEVHVAGRSPTTSPPTRCGPRHRRRGPRSSSRCRSIETRRTACRCATGSARRGCGCAAGWWSTSSAPGGAHRPRRKCLRERWSCPTARSSTRTTVLPRRRHVYFYRELPDEVPVPFDIPVLYRDDDIVVVDKPHFLATMPRGRHVAQTALVRLRRELDLPELVPAHRLDRLTAGVLLFTTRREVRGAYQTLFARGWCARRTWRGRPSIRISSCRWWCGAGSSSGADSYRRSRNRASRTPRR